ncbi:phage tail tip lysozyme [Acetobacter lambici]|uniref:Phage tail tip lysozyme n=1 Tax=Acetobacter lambici TaxID=1332824 RepID=A0ABT1F259_9PROT|nr:phage tail tip lysozyme [Acetobacter lambici]MCP1243236.1 phage tail tip lysozyme [Acetobacter lambici]MCP1258309.1 phage tail tip lysozyme [Acetobacter lambici]
MGATVSIVLDATDRASKKFDAFNNRVASIQAPVRNLQRSLSRFSNVMGITRLRKGMQDLSRSTLNTFRSVGRLVPEMGTLTGAASIAGVYKLASAWAEVGSNLRTSARSMGMAPGRLMALRNAARLSGGSADAMSGALGQLSTQKWEAVNGFAPEAAAQFQALGISMEELKKLSPEQLFDRIANKIRGIKDPAAQSIAALKLFGEAGQGLLPVFQQTAQEYQQNIRLAERYGVMNQKGADAAARMQNSQRQLTLAVEGFGYSIAEAAEPAITDILHQMSDLISANREWIAQDLAGYVRQLAEWLKNGGWEQIKGKISGLLQTISSVVDRLGGWKSAAKDAAIALAVLWGAPVLTGILSVTTALLGVFGAMKSIISLKGGLAGALAGGGAYVADEALKKYDPNDSLGAWIDKTIPGASAVDNAASYLGLGCSYEQQKQAQAAIDQASAGKKESARGVQQFFMRNGYSSAQAAGLVANLAQEDEEFDPGKVGDNGTAYGIAQWHKARQDDFKRVMGRDIHGSSREDQLKFMQWELDHQSYLGGDEIRHARTASQAAALASVNYFRPGLTQADQLREMSNRAGLGTDWYNALSAPPAQMPTPPKQDAGGGLDGTTSRLRVEISHDNAPPGSSVKVTSASSNLKVASITQQRAMDPTNTALGN